MTSNGVIHNYTNVVAFLEDETAATVIEYRLIAAGISVAIITVVGTLGSNLNATSASITVLKQASWK